MNLEQSKEINTITMTGYIRTYGISGDTITVELSDSFHGVFDYKAISSIKVLMESETALHSIRKIQIGDHVKIENGRLEIMPSETNEGSFERYILTDRLIKLEG